MPGALVVPDRFNKNAPDVRAMGTQAQTGTWLINYMCRRLGVPDLGGVDVLDLGCGCRFADAIVNNALPIKSYTGIDVDQEMIGFLSANIVDPRLSFHHWNAHNQFFNPTGQPMTAATSLPTGGRQFDVICMFSVITHQVPHDAEMLFRILRRHIRPRGRLFFSANIQAMHEGYREMIPEQPTAFSAYSRPLLTSLLARSGWRILSIQGKTPHGVPIQDSLLCAPKPSLTRRLLQAAARMIGFDPRPGQRARMQSSGECEAPVPCMRATGRLNSASADV